MRLFRVICCLAVSASCAIAAADWGPAQFLVGHWTGAGSGQPGAGSGAFSFTADLQGKVLLRRSFNDIPAAGGKPASRHEDLMVVYRDESSKDLRAIYFDSEDHVIHYAVKPATAGGVMFVTEGGAGDVRYRLTYTPMGKDGVGIRFEVAPPGKDFAVYVEGTARRDP